MAPQEAQEESICSMSQRHIVHPPAERSADSKGATWAQMEAAALGSGCGGVYSSISAALEQARDGDVVCVYPGEYNESVRLRKSVTLCNSMGPVLGQHVIVRNEGGSTCVSTSRGARIVGMQFVHTGGDTSGRGRDGPRCLEVCSGELTAERCSFMSELGSAVMAAEKGSIVMRDCKLAGCGRCGLICVHGAKAECVGCDLSGNALNGADVQSGGCVILHGSRVSDNKQTGVLVADPLSFVHMEGNDICDNLRRGVTAQKSGSFCLSGNRIMRNKNIGVIGIGPWDEPNRPLKISDNVISCNVSTGLWIQKGKADVEGNVIDGNGDSGVVCFGADSDLVLRSNIISNNKGAGVSIHATHSVALTDNFIGARHKRLGRDFRDAFMQAMHPRLGAHSLCRQLDDNVCSQVFAACSFDDACPNKGCGLELHATRSAVLTGNLIANSGELGVLVCEASSATLESNRLLSNTGVGLVVRGADTHVTSRDNVVARGGADGVEVSGGATWFSCADEASLNGGLGVVLASGGSFLKGIKIDHNHKGGLLVGKECAGASVVGCEVTRNIGEALLVQGSVGIHGGKICARTGSKGLVVEGTGRAQTLDRAPEQPAAPLFRDSDRATAMEI